MSRSYFVCVVTATVERTRRARTPLAGAFLLDPVMRIIAVVVLILVLIGTTNFSERIPLSIGCWEVDAEYRSCRLYSCIYSETFLHPMYQSLITCTLMNRLPAAFSFFISVGIFRLQLRPEKPSSQFSHTSVAQIKMALFSTNFCLLAFWR